MRRRARVSVCVSLMCCAGAAAVGLIAGTGGSTVGVIPLELPPGFSLVSSPFVTVNGGGPQTLAELFGSQLPDGSEVYRFVPGEGYVTYTYVDGEWYDSKMTPGAGVTTIRRGDGLWVRNASSEPITVFLAGQVPGPEPVEVDLPAGRRLVSFSFPIVTGDVDWVGLVPDDRDEIHIFDPHAGYISYTYFRGTWYDSGMAPSSILIEPGAAFWYKSRSAKSWIQARTYGSE